jgi:hypothetical protein
MKRYVEFYPWVDLLHSSDERGVLYDLFSKRIHILSRQEFSDLKESLAKPILENKTTIERLLSLKFLLSIDEPIYMDRLRVGSKLDDIITIFKLGPPVLHAEIVFDGGCKYHDSCPLAAKNLTLSHSCELCYVGDRCRSSNEIPIRESYTEELTRIIRELGVINVSVSGNILQEEGTLQDIEYFVGRLFENKVQNVFFNIPQFQIVQSNTLTKGLLSDLLSKYGTRIKPNISMFFEKREQFLETLKMIWRLFDGLLSNSTATVAFDLSKLTEIEPAISNGTFSNFSNVCLAPYITDKNTDKVGIAMTGSEVSLFKSWLHGPDVLGYTLVKGRNYVPCLALNMLIDSDLRIANCKGCWIKGEAYKIDRHSLSRIRTRWCWREGEKCRDCPLRACCITCKTFMDYIFSKVDTCPLTSCFWGADQPGRVPK